MLPAERSVVVRSGVEHDAIETPHAQTTTMDDMYGRANPKPLPPSYDSDDIRHVQCAPTMTRVPGTDALVRRHTTARAIASTLD